MITGGIGPFTRLQEQLNAITNAMGPSTRLQEQMQAVAAAMCPGPRLYSQISAINATLAAHQPLGSVVAARALTLQHATAAQLHVQLAPGPRTVLTAEARDAWRVVSEAAEIRIEIPTVAGLRHFDRLLRDGEISEDFVAEAEASIGANEDLAAAVDLAADTLSRGRPWLTNRRARQILTVWIWMCWTGMLIALALIAGPIASAVGAAAGAVGPGSVSKKGAEVLFLSGTTSPHEEPPTAGFDRRAFEGRAALELDGACLGERADADLNNGKRGCQFG